PATPPPGRRPASRGPRWPPLTEVDQAPRAPASGACKRHGRGLRYLHGESPAPLPLLPGCAMSFAGALNLLRPTLPYYLALTRHGLLRLKPDGFELHPNLAAPPLAQEMARTMFALGASACIEGYVTSRMLAQGPKVFAFDAL